MSSYKKCKYCGNMENVFDENKGSLNESICIRCKIDQIKNSVSKKQVEDTCKWEIELKKLEEKVSKQIISISFPGIKFKRCATYKLIDIMKRYPIRKVFEACVFSEENDFSVPKIENKCKRF